MADPGERSLDDPAFGKHDEAMQFIAPDDRQLPGAGLGDGGRGLLPLVPGISEDKLDEGEEAACAPIEDEQSAVARSCIAAEWTTTFNSRPSVSTRICRLRPVTFLAASKPCGSSVEPPFEPLWRFDFSVAAYDVKRLLMLTVGSPRGSRFSPWSALGRHMMGSERRGGSICRACSAAFYQA